MNSVRYTIALAVGAVIFIALIPIMWAVRGEFAVGGEACFILLPVFLLWWDVVKAVDK